MYKMVVTEKNYKDVVGRLSKFFNQEDYIAWFARKGKFNKRIRSILDFKNGDTIDLKMDSKIFMMKENRENALIHILYESASFVDEIAIQEGMTVYFFGNKIIIKEHLDLVMENGMTINFYSCIQKKD